MDQNFPAAESTAIRRNDTHSFESTAPVRQLEHSKIFRYAVRVAGFEVFLVALDALLEPIKGWGDLIRVPGIIIQSSILFAMAARENYKAGSNPPASNANHFDPSAVLVHKADSFSYAISKAAYEAALKAFHSLPGQIRGSQDFMKATKGLHQSLRVFISVASENYQSSLMARNMPTSTLLSADMPKVQAMFAALEYDVFGALDGLPHEIRYRQELVNASRSFHRSFHLMNSRAREQGYAHVSILSQAKCFFFRSCDVFCRPSQFATIFLDFCSLVHSFWGGVPSGQEVVLPISSLTKRPSSRLSRLLLHHSRDLPQDVVVDAFLSNSLHPWTVAVIDLNAVPREITRGRYSTGADIYGLTAMLFLVEILNFLLSPSWIILFDVLPKIVGTWIFVSGYGDGTLSLFPPSQVQRYSTPAYALLLDEDFSLVLSGAQDVVEAIALSGFHFAHPIADLFPLPVWKLVTNLVLEGCFQGFLCLMAILPVWRLLRPSFASPLSQTIGMQVLFSIFMVVTSLGPLRKALRLSGSGNLTAFVQLVVEGIADLIRMVARVAPILVAWFLYIHDYSMFNELQLLVDLIPPLCLAFIVSVPSQKYPIRTSRFLAVLGNPPIRKWRFATPAAAATFQCLVLCHGIRRPVRNIDVRGLLETLIPDQREVWRVWKGRVADRITHEEDIIFSSTLPTFRDVRRQMQLKVYLDESQSAYKTYRCQYLTQTSS